MGLFDGLFGSNDARRQPGAGASVPVSDDEQAIARYRYLIKTAPPEALEQAHAEAFARLTPDQRRMVLEQLGAELPQSERAAAMKSGDNPQALARVATRAELQQPGAMERAFGRIGNRPGGMGFGGMMAGSFIGSMAGVVLGTAVAQNLFGSHGTAADAAGSDSGGHANEATPSDADFDAGGDFGSGSDFGGGGFDI